MSDIFLATLLLVGGFGWSALVVAAMASHPTGGTDFAMYPFLAGVIAFALGIAWWIGIIASWVI